jgi:hypothetical protein
MPNKAANAYPFPWRFERQRYSDLYLLSQVTENQVQKQILELLHAYDVDAVAIDAGGRKQRGRMMSAARVRGIQLAGLENIKTGAIPEGWPDLEATLAPKGRALFIEVKAPAWIDGKGKIVRAAGRPSVEQLDLLHSKHDRGALVMVAWSLDDVTLYLGGKIEGNRLALQ